ncbi:MAG: CPBP family intramembrane metalloprotease [Proteobacteria bacterium]|nr:CPBP family intramembrane metalloprotease [Pseudomonadota bacterium]
MSTLNNQNKKNHDLFKFFIIAFVTTWLIQLPRVLVDNDLAQVPAVLSSLSTFAMVGPFLAAFWLTYKAGGLKEIKVLWKRGWDFSFEKKWLAVVFLVPAFTSGLTILGINLVGGEILWEHQPLPLMMAVPILIIIFLTQALPEEYGWRGFALDRLQARWNALTASLILGFLWGLWHLPLHFMVGTTQEVIPAVEYILKQMVGAIFYTWIYNNTKRNLFLAILLHAVWNVFGGLVPYWVTSQGRWVNFGVEVIIAAIIVAVYGAQTLVREDNSSL